MSETPMRPADLPSYEPYLVSMTINGIEEWSIQQGFRQCVNGNISECLQHARRWFPHMMFIRHWSDDDGVFGSEFDLKRKG